jgi:hypothetical protein
MNQLHEIRIIEETDKYLKIIVEGLSFSRLINFILKQGKKEEFHLVEMELLLKILDESKIVEKEVGKNVYKTLSHFLQNEEYMDFNLNSKQLLDEIEKLKTLITEKMMINGEIKAFKNSPTSEYNILITER